jgi:hypothetical protein
LEGKGYGIRDFEGFGKPEKLKKYQFGTNNLKNRI